MVTRDATPCTVRKTARKVRKEEFQDSIGITSLPIGAKAQRYASFTY